MTQDINTLKGVKMKGEKIGLYKTYLKDISFSISGSMRIQINAFSKDLLCNVCICAHNIYTYILIQLEIKKKSLY